MRIKNLILILFFNLSFAQYCVVDKSLITLAQQTPKSVEKSTKTLTDYFKTKAKTQKELFVLNYLWIIMNVKYDYDFANKSPKHTIMDCSAANTIKTRKTVCEGFANLLKEFCDLSNIKSETVVGYAKGWDYEPEDGIITKSNHKWNVIFLDNKYQLVDVTWDANLLESETKTDYFYTHGKLKYIFMKHETFLLSHFPVDKKWQLIKKPISNIQFFSLDLDNKIKLQADILNNEFFNDRYIEDVNRNPKLK